MTKRFEAYRLVTAGLFVAIGLILPYITAHGIGVPGTILLPMHIPILLCGLLCGPKYGALCGIIVPIISSLLTGMPPAYPMLPIMIVQLFAMGLVSGLLYHRLRLHLYISLIGAMLIGQATYGLMFHSLIFMGGGEPIRALSVPAAIMAGLPGLAIQLILIPAIVAVCKRYVPGLFYAWEKLPESAEPDVLTSEALRLIKTGEATCVVIKGGEIIHKADGRGVSPLLNAYSDIPDMLKDAYVVDKIIGKAAAMILTLGGAAKVHGVIMSVSGQDYLEKHGIAVECGRCVDVISGRDGNGICPIEKSVLETDDPHKGVEIIRAAIEGFKKQAANQ